MDEEIQFFKSNYWEEFPKIAQLRTLKYRKIKFIEFGETEAIEKWQERYPWEFADDYKFVYSKEYLKHRKQNAIYRVCALPNTTAKGIRKIEYFYTIDDNKFQALIRGMLSFKLSAGCASWMSEFVDENNKPDVANVQVVCLAKGLTAAFRAKMEAVHMVDNCGNLRKSYINPMDADSFEYLKNNLMRVGSVMKVKK